MLTRGPKSNMEKELIKNKQFNNIINININKQMSKLQIIKS